MRTQREVGLHQPVLTIFCLSPCLSLPLAIEWILETKPPTPEFPVLLATKIFIRTIRSSDKGSTEGWGHASERAGCASRTSFLQHSILRPQACSHQSETQQPPSLPPVRPGGKVPASPNIPTPHSHTIPAGSALSCPWAVGVGHTACVLGGEGTRASWFLSRKLSLLSAMRLTRSLGGSSFCT